jgi:uncharacterized membrane protein (DUF106 family)
MKGMTTLILVMVISLAIAFLWNAVPAIKNAVHFVLDPTAGALLNFNVYLGLLILSGLLTVATTIVQKYATDQETLRQLKKEQKETQAEMKKFRDNPAKMMEFNKKQLEKMPQMMELSMRPLLYTAIPFILLLRWFGDYFTLNKVLNSSFIFPAWVWVYLVSSIIFSSIFRKVFKVV